MLPTGGGMTYGITKQKINTRSSTTLELVASDDVCWKIFGEQLLVE